MVYYFSSDNVDNCNHNEKQQPHFYQRRRVKLSGGFRKFVCNSACHRISRRKDGSW